MCKITADSCVIHNICCFVRLLGQQSQLGFQLVLEVGLKIIFVSLAFEDESLVLDIKYLITRPAISSHYHSSQHAFLHIPFYL